MKIVITGAAGFIGSHVADIFIKAGHKIVAIDNLVRGCRDNLPEEVIFFTLDIRDQDIFPLLKREQPEVVLHLAAQADAALSLTDFYSDADVNIMGTLNVLEACRIAGVRRVVYASSAAVYGEPLYLPVNEEYPVFPKIPYGVSKHVPELYLKLYGELYGLEYAVLRLANVYGPGQGVDGEGGVVNVFLDKLIKGDNPVIFGDGEQTRDFIYVKDVAEAFLLAAGSVHNGLYNIGSGTAVSISSLLEQLKKIFNYNKKTHFASPRPGEIRHSCLANGKARDVLGWMPKYTLEKGLLEIVNGRRVK